jgi:large subunit ribosomal protein L9
MEVILLEQVEKLGAIGTIANVKGGYARNFLLPQGKVLRATEANKEYFERERKNIEAANDTKKAEAETILKKLNGKTIILIRQASDEGKLYGSVMPRDIAIAVEELSNTTIKKSSVILSAPIREVGIFNIKVRLHAEIIAEITFRIARTTEEAKKLEIKVLAPAEEVADYIAGSAEEAPAEGAQKEVAEAPTAE